MKMGWRERIRLPHRPLRLRRAAATPRTGLSLDLLRSDLSHEISAKIARLVGLVAEWRRGRYLSEDPDDAVRLLSELETLHLRHGRLCSERFTTLRHFVGVLLAVRIGKGLVAPMRRGRVPSLGTLDRFEKSLGHLRASNHALVEGLSARFAWRVDEILRIATDEVRREFGGGLSPGSIGVVLDSDGTAVTWVPSSDRERWGDILRNLIRNGVQASEEKEERCGPVRVRLTHAGASSGTVIEITDEGVGIAGDILDKMWRTGAGRHGKGRGQGLTEAKYAFLSERARIDIRSAPGSGTAVRLEIPSTDIRIEPIPAWRLRPVLAAAIILVAFTIAGASWIRPRPLEAIRQVGETQVEGLDGEGKRIWVRDLNEEILKNHIANRWTPAGQAAPSEPLLVLRDRLGRSRGAVLATQPPQGPGHVWLLNGKGLPKKVLSVRWHTPERETLGKLMCMWETIIPWPAPIGQAIVLQVRDNRYSPTSTQFFTPDGDSVGAYYHWGHLQFHSASDVDGDGRTEVLLYGVANHAQYDTTVVPHDPGVYIDCVIMLEVANVSGQAYPHQDWPGMPRADEEAYLLIPPLVDGVRPEIRGIDVGAGTAGKPPPIEIVIVDGRIYRVDGDLLPLSCGTGDNTLARSLAPTRPIAPITYFRHNRRRSLDIEVQGGPS